jgi:hypothetical protein
MIVESFGCYAGKSHHDHEAGGRTVSRRDHEASRRGQREMVS